MSVYILHPQTVTTPSYSSSVLKARHVTAPILPGYCTARPVATIAERQSLRTAIPVQNVHRSERSAVLPKPIEELLGLGTPAEHPVRKRERLNHLTAEEKQNRRKLKNRVAAQTARDRKKYRASKLEEAVRILVLENGKLREENKCLKKTCEELKSQNAELEDLLNRKRVHEEPCSETEVSSSSMPSSSLGSAEGTGDDAFIADFSAFLSSDEMQEIIGEICATDGTDATLPDADGTVLEFEHFCSKILSEIDDADAQSHTAHSKSPKSSCNTRRMDCTTPDIIIAPEYLKSDPELQTHNEITVSDSMECIGSTSAVNFDMESDPDALPDASGSRSPDASGHFTSSPSFTFFDDIKEDNSDASSPLITDNDPMFCVPHKWDIDDDYM